MKTNDFSIVQGDCFDLIQDVKTNSVDLILTDPPYIISRDSGMDKHYNMVKENEENNIEYIKTEAEWEAYKLEKGDALMFPSNFMYPHEVMPVTKGTRYSIITWFV